jgi:hypothetical protein
MKNVTFLSTLLISVMATATSVSYQSPLGKTEECSILPHIPGGKYSADDTQKEDQLCKINFYDGKTALCPKTWSTSPAIVIQDLKPGSSVQAQEAICSARKFPTKAKFKSTMNGDKTSGTYSPSPLLYYHFSRYFETLVTVPVAVYRTIDKDIHLSRVASKASGGGSMMTAAWDIMRKSLEDPSYYNPVDDLFTPDRKQVYGVLLKDSGERYGTEINGLRTAGGETKYFDFQKTAPMLALRSELPLNEAVIYGEQQARKSPRMNADLGPTKVSGLQMVLWMKELTEMTLLDFIFNQRDRVGNIDYKWIFYWLKASGEVQRYNIDSDFARRHQSQIKVPAEIKAFNPLLVQRTILGDNDAGGRAAYTNYTKTTKVLEGFRHYNSSLYKKLLELNHDLQTKGPIYNYLKANFKLPKAHFDLIVSNAKAATGILKASCESGRLQFDLRAKEFLAGQNTLETLNCETGEVR